eukprot:5008344-Amphidinium_carterae.1
MKSSSPSHEVIYIYVDIKLTHVYQQQSKPQKLDFMSLLGQAHFELLGKPGKHPQGLSRDGFLANGLVKQWGQMLAMSKRSAFECLIKGPTASIRAAASLSYPP